jgi:hypothetical protein
VIWLWGIEAGSITSILELTGLLLILSPGIRTSWNIAILWHGTGQTLLVAAVDRKARIKRSKHTRKPEHN